MSARLGELVSDHLQVRRALGYKLHGTERLLFAFVDYLHQVGAQTITVEDALAFATAPTGAAPRWHALRLSAIRCFARWAHAQDGTIQVPPQRILPARSTRAQPYIYTDGEIGALITAAGRLRPAMRAATFQALVA